MEASAYLREGEATGESVVRQSLCCGLLCLCGKCFCFAIALVMFLTLGPFGLCLCGVIVTLQEQTPLSAVEIVGHRGQPIRYPEYSVEGYLSLPPGIIWEMDLQRPTANGTVYLAHDPLDAGEHPDRVSLDEILALASESNATLMPEFKGGGADPMWEHEDITAIARRLCDRSPWMQTFYWMHPGVATSIKDGCPSAKVMCLFAPAYFYADGLPPHCDAEGRPWIDTSWVAMYRWRRGETRPLGIYTVNDILHARAVAWLAAPAFGIFSDDAPSLLGFEEPLPNYRGRFGNRFFWGFVLYSVLSWSVVALLMSPLAPAVTPRLARWQRWWRSHPLYLSVLGALLFYLMWQEQQSEPQTYFLAFLTGAVTGLVWIPILCAVAVAAKALAQPSGEAEMELAAERAS